MDELYSGIFWGYSTIFCVEKHFHNIAQEPCLITPTPVLTSLFWCRLTSFSLVDDKCLFWQGSSLKLTPINFRDEKPFIHLQQSALIRRTRTAQKKNPSISGYYNRVGKMWDKLQGCSLELNIQQAVRHSRFAQLVPPKAHRGFYQSPHAACLFHPARPHSDSIHFTGFPIYHFTVYNRGERKQRADILEVLQSN